MSMPESPPPPDRPSPDRPSPDRLPFDRLVAMLADPDVPEAALRPYLVASGATPFAARLRPDPARVALPPPAELPAGAAGAGWFDGLHRLEQALAAASRTRRRLTFERRLLTHPGRAIVVAEGDSWFQYPILLQDMVDHLSHDHNVLCGSNPGDTLADMARAGEVPAMLTELAERGLRPKALLLSAGGNDIAGDALQALLHPWRPRVPPERLIRWDRVATALETQEGQYRDLIGQARSVFPGLPVVIHGYGDVEPLPDQGPTLIQVDGWLGRPLRALGYPDGDAQRDVARLLIARLNESRAGLARTVPGVTALDLRPAVRGDWADELHPTSAAFGRAAEEVRQALWQLDRAGPSTPRAGPPTPRVRAPAAPRLGPAAAR